MKKTPLRNQSWNGWWIYNEVEQWVSSKQKPPKPFSRFLVWENTRILRAKNREAAYRKAIVLGNEGHPIKEEKGEWRFVGISMLLPIFDSLEDGAELIWWDKGLMTSAQISKLVKSKEDLPVFNDDDDNLRAVNGDDASRAAWRAERRSTSRSRGKR